MPCYIVLQWCNVVLSVIIVLCCFIMLVYKIIMLCLVIMVDHFLILFCTDMVYLHTMPPWYSVAQRFYTNASQSSHLPAFTTDTIHAAIWYTVDDPKRLLHSWHTYHSNFLVLTMHQAQMFLTTQVIHHTSLYTHPTQSMHVFSSNADDPKRFLKIYNYYPDIVYF